MALVGGEGSEEVKCWVGKGVVSGAKGGKGEMKHKERERKRTGEPGDWVK